MTETGKSKRKNPLAVAIAAPPVAWRAPSVWALITVVLVFGCRIIEPADKAVRTTTELT